VGNLQFVRLGSLAVAFLSILVFGTAKAHADPLLGYSQGGLFRPDILVDLSNVVYSGGKLTADGTTIKVTYSGGATDSIFSNWGSFHLEAFINSAGQLTSSSGVLDVSYAGQSWYHSTHIEAFGSGSSKTYEFRYTQSTSGMPLPPSPFAPVNGSAVGVALHGGSAPVPTFASPFSFSTGTADIAPVPAPNPAAAGTVLLCGVAGMGLVRRRRTSV